MTMIIAKLPFLSTYKILVSEAKFLNRGEKIVLLLLISQIHLPLGRNVPFFGKDGLLKVSLKMEKKTANFVISSTSVP